MEKNVNLHNNWCKKNNISTGLWWLWLVPIILIIDLSSKYFILKYFFLGETQNLLPCLNLYYIRNYGAAFSLFAGNNGWQYWLFVNSAIVICGILVILMYRTNVVHKLKNISYSFVVGGALANLFDRIWHGFVVDMIDFHIGIWHFATFNIADCTICIGITLMMLEAYLSLKNN
ncbi:Lipoprotein signal peptidase [Candidatus Profftia lariciata]|uniref:signal peptidase II n=1 Tax=Candidatus Profftia lariciata TaxID=1987921 RepID=UPI001D02B0A9|nr:signal peptidase II [Candidatus Profftia lariciata]UDG81761.1 Lipoprotein signal peptidase [Candidatus Profftia lariciata]